LSKKTAPIGICDFCGEDFSPDVSHYTSKGKPRFHCSHECRNTANSRAGADIRAEKMQARVRRGEWQNPSPLTRDDATDAEIAFFQRRVSAGMSEARKREVREGRWRNPALGAEARRKLSRPRKHGDNPVLHSAIEKLHGGTMDDLTPEEREAYLAYRRRLRKARIGKVRAYQRRRYRAEMETEEGRAKQRTKWQRGRERQAQCGPNRRLVRARQRVGLSQRALAQAVGVSEAAVGKWERFSVVPRSESVRRKIEELLGSVF
jgi:DNA-binding transcriptional regulator YiaG